MNDQKSQHNQEIYQDAKSACEVHNKTAFSYCVRGVVHKETNENIILK